MMLKILTHYLFCGLGVLIGSIEAQIPTAASLIPTANASLASASAAAYATLQALAPCGVGPSQGPSV